MGTGVMSGLLEKAQQSGAFMLNDGYYFSYATEIAALDKRHDDVLILGQQALELLPRQEVLLLARVHARMGFAAWREGMPGQGIASYREALQLDPGIVRRIGASIPVTFTDGSDEVSRHAIRFLKRSPRFREDADGFRVEIRTADTLSACLFTPNGDTVGCYSQTPAAGQSAEEHAQYLARGLHEELFNLGYQISDAQMALLRGSSVIMRPQGGRSPTTSLETFTGR
jgi:tetratricopeptide (TPR) repeat protein